MRLLLDTHAFLWWVDGGTRLSVRARRAIANPANECLVSVVSQALSESLRIVSADPIFRKYGVRRLWEPPHLVSRNALQSSGAWPMP